MKATLAVAPVLGEALALVPPALTRRATYRRRRPSPAPPRPAWQYEALGHGTGQETTLGLEQPWR